MGTETVSALAAEVHMRPPLAGNVRVLAIDGRSGAGKSSLADALSAELRWPVFHLQDVYPGRGGLAAAAERMALWVVMPLLGGADPRWRRYDWTRGRSAEWRSTPVADGLIVEGCGCGAADVRPYLSLLVWVEAPEEVRRRRLDARADAEVHAPHRDAWTRQEDAFYTEHTPWEYADVTVTSC